MLLVFVGVQLAQTMGALDGTIVATALPTITDDLGGFSRITWVITTYALAGVASMPLYGKLGDLYGRRRMLLGAIALFLGASLVCGAAQTLDQLLVARFLQGLGAGGLGTLSMAVLADVVPPRQLGRWMGYQGVGFAVSSVAGPLVGGLFVDHLSWRWAFFVNLPVGAVAAAILAVCLPRSGARIEHALDWAGSALLVASLSCLVLVATLGGETWAWTSPQLLGLAAAVPLLGWAFVRRELTAPEPVLPLRLLRDRVIRASIGVNVTSGILIWCGIFFVPLFVQEVRGATPTQAGFTLMPLMFGAAIGTLAAGRSVERTGRIRSWPIVGSVLMAAGVGLLATLGLGSAVVVVALWALVLGVGIGFVMQPSLLAAQNAAPVADLGTATSTVLLFRSLGSTVGIPVFGGILNAGLVGHGKDAAAFAHAVPLVFLAAVPVAVLSIAVALRLPDRPLREGLQADLAEDPDAHPIPIVDPVV
ncbi:MFS transporter [Aquihabitans sp. G128]|uniref:MDR family MFS transporter n=1 Tax=Aquihabitans sp. G128 TaxID=2849779 RepID=UPI001C21BFF1|nr:MDR family MFS transporter [Aquihabitans sp. G128]QXC61400.1 MFS transporter [Aquihabitans sp. G128]